MECNKSRFELFKEGPAIIQAKSTKDYVIVSLQVKGVTSNGLIQMGWIRFKDLVYTHRK
jgi:hypothetical protein